MIEHKCPDCGYVHESQPTMGGVPGAFVHPNETVVGGPMHQAAINGHEMGEDHPIHNPNITRQTCAYCGRAFLRYKGGPAYGSALTDRCNRESTDG